MLKYTQNWIVTRNKNEQQQQQQQPHIVSINVGEIPRRNEILYENDKQQNMNNNNKIWTRENNLNGV